jgi:hypothetical protein
MRGGAAAPAPAPAAPWHRSRAAQLAALALMLLLAGPVTTLLHEAFLPHGVRHAERGQREQPHKLGMAAFVGGGGAHAHAVSAVTAWHADEAAAAHAAARSELMRQASQSASATAALTAAISAHAELDRLHAHQREMIGFHAAAQGDEAQADEWARAELRDYEAKRAEADAGTGGAGVAGERAGAEGSAGAAAGERARSERAGGSESSRPGGTAGVRRALPEARAARQRS